MSDYMQLPADLPVPVDDGAANHLEGMTMPSVVLEATDARAVDVGALGKGVTVLYIYPMTGTPGVELPEGWDEIPGARGCTPETCGFRDHFADLRNTGADRVFGLSTQDLATQRELVERLELPYPLLSDPESTLGTALRLPAFEAAGQRRYSRITLIIVNDVIDHVFYPIFPPNAHAIEVLGYLSDIC
jgi:peroxiredoxin